MKRILLLAIMALSISAINAQSTDSSSDKSKAKTEKQDKKSKKSKKSAKPIEIKLPELKSEVDSTTYYFGVSQSNGLKSYIVNQLGVDTTYLNDFVKGLLDRVELDPEDKKLQAYNAGMDVAKQIMTMNDNYSNDYYAATPEKKTDCNLLAKSIVAGMLDQTDLKADSAMNLFRDRMEKRHEANKEEMYGANRLAGEKFLEENKLKEGVITLPSGLQYKVITQGNGEKPKADDKVNVNYEGKLIDGTVFDSSYKRNKPAQFKCNQVIKGWTEALCMMPVGSKWELYIPYQLAYGDRQSGKDIKPYSALTFTVELLSIEGANTTVAADKITEPAANKKATIRKK
jgi:FKBP-type peptidyl-prolyl cis-trans isomerase FklB